jgi:predicted nucleic acid-binding protein
VKTVFVDSNIFLSFFRAGEVEQAKVTRLLNLAAAGKVALVTGPPVLFEVAWTLRSSYDLPPTKILDVLSAIVMLPGLKLLDADVFSEAISLARRSGIHFSDAYIVALAHVAGADEIASFNRGHLERLGAKVVDL